MTLTQMKIANIYLNQLVLVNPEKNDNFSNQFVGEVKEIVLIGNHYGLLVSEVDGVGNTFTVEIEQVNKSF